MHVKVFRIEGLANIETKVQSWLNSNPKIKIEAMSQSAINAADAPTAYLYVITIIYSTN